jgi:hypothetical protein
LRLRKACRGGQTQDNGSGTGRDRPRWAQTATAWS